MREPSVSPREPGLLFNPNAAVSALTVVSGSDLLNQLFPLPTSQQIDAATLVSQRGLPGFDPVLLDVKYSGKSSHSFLRARRAEVISSGSSKKSGATLSISLATARAGLETFWGRPLLRNFSVGSG